VAEAGDMPGAISLPETLDPTLADDQPYLAARAECLARSGRTADALAACARAIALAASPADGEFLAGRRSRLLS
jgi:predicted RNA polymerase sigma factor